VAEDTASIVAGAVEASTTVADTEPIPGDETPEAVASEEPSPGAEASADEPPAEGAVAEPPAPQKRRGPIPFDRHQAVLTKTRNEAKAAQEALQKRIDDLAKYEADDYQNRIRLMDLLEASPDKAVAILKQIDPERFGKLSWAEQQAAAAVAAETPAQGAAEKPQPDALLPDGTLGYSAEGAQKLLEWRLEQERKGFDQRFEELKKQIAPISEERQAREAFAQSVQRMTPVLENARKNWRKFAENEPAIREYLANNKTAGLSDAYIAVVVPKLDEAVTTSEATARKKVIEELNTKGRATGVIPGKIPAAASSESEGGTKSTADLVRAALRSAA
jgi:hypothetical protein